MRKTPKNYRVYALILGQILQEREFMNCTIVRMDSAEQLKRDFAPIQGEFDNDMVKEYSSYATFLPYVDPLKLKSDYVIYFDSSEEDSVGAVGDATRHIELACRYLSIGMAQDIRAAKGEIYTAFYPYIYQIVKVYQLNEKGEEINCEFKLTNHTVMSPRRPEKNEWMDSKTESYLQKITDFKDLTLKRALKYLYRAEIGHMILDSPEKSSLDHFKSMEIIIDSLSQEKKFKDRLSETKEILKLSDEEERQINKLWEERSELGDIAHPSNLDQTERYANQFPIPSNVQYSGLRTSIAGNLILKYFEYKRGIFEVMIEDVFPGGMENTIGIVNPDIESNHFMISTNERDKNRLEKAIKTEIAKTLGIEEKNIRKYDLLPGRKAVVLWVDLV